MVPRRKVGALTGRQRSQHARPTVSDLIEGNGGGRHGAGNRNETSGRHGSPAGGRRAAAEDSGRHGTADSRSDSYGTGRYEARGTGAYGSRRAADPGVDAYGSGRFESAPDAYGSGRFGATSGRPTRSSGTSAERSTRRSADRGASERSGSGAYDAAPRPARRSADDPAPTPGRRRADRRTAEESGGYQPPAADTGTGRRRAERRESPAGADFPRPRDPSETSSSRRASRGRDGDRIGAAELIERTGGYGAAGGGRRRADRASEPYDSAGGRRRADRRDSAGYDDPAASGRFRTGDGVSTSGPYGRSDERSGGRDAAATGAGNRSGSYDTGRAADRSGSYDTGRAADRSGGYDTGRGTGSSSADTGRSTRSGGFDTSRATDRSGGYDTGGSEQPARADRTGAYGAAQATGTGRYPRPDAAGSSGRRPTGDAARTGAYPSSNGSSRGAGQGAPVNGTGRYRTAGDSQPTEVATSGRYPIGDANRTGAYAAGGGQQSGPNPVHGNGRAGAPQGQPTGFYPAPQGTGAYPVPPAGRPGAANGTGGYPQGTGVNGYPNNGQQQPAGPNNSGGFAQPAASHTSGGVPQVNGYPQGSGISGGFPQANGYPQGVNGQPAPQSTGQYQLPQAAGQNNSGGFPRPNNSGGFPQPNNSGGFPQANNSGGFPQANGYPQGVNGQPAPQATGQYQVPPAAGDRAVGYREPTAAYPLPVDGRPQATSSYPMQATQTPGTGTYQVTSAGRANGAAVPQGTGSYPAPTESGPNPQVIDARPAAGIDVIRGGSSGALVRVSDRTPAQRTGATPQAPTASVPWDGTSGVQTIDLVKVYGSGGETVTALAGITVSAERNKFTAIMGPSGSGKSTLLHCMAGLDAPTSGRVLLGQTELSELPEKQLTKLRRDRVGFVFQTYALLPQLSVRQNITLPLEVANKRIDESWLRTVVDALDLGPVLKQRPTRLSGGQQQRVAMARALLPRPEVVFADEPTGALDAATAREMLQFLRASVRDLGQTVVMVTHDPLAAEHTDHVLLLHQGNLAAQIANPTAPVVLDALTVLDRMPSKGWTAHPNGAPSALTSAHQVRPSGRLALPAGRSA